MSNLRTALIVVGVAILTFGLVAIILTYSLGGPEVSDGIASAVPLPTATPSR